MVDRLTRSCRANGCREGIHESTREEPAAKMMGLANNTAKFFREALRQKSFGICDKLLENGVVRLPDAVEEQSSLDYQDLDPEMQDYLLSQMERKTKSANDE